MTGRNVKLFLYALVSCMASAYIRCRLGIEIDARLTESSRFPSELANGAAKCHPGATGPL